MRYPATPAAYSTQRNPRLLLAGDDPSNRDLLCQILCADHTVKAVASGEEAWKAAQRKLPDLILSDVLMP